MNNNKENDSTAFNGTIYHEGFKFHRKYVGKKSATYCCCHNRFKSCECSAKIKINLMGKVIKSEGDHSNLKPGKRLVTFKSQTPKAKTLKHRPICPTLC